VRVSVLEVAPLAELDGVNAGQWLGRVC